MSTQILTINQKTFDELREVLTEAGFGGRFMEYSVDLSNLELIFARRSDDDPASEIMKCSQCGAIWPANKLMEPRWQRTRRDSA